MASQKIRVSFFNQKATGTGGKARRPYLFSSNDEENEEKETSQNNKVGRGGRGATRQS